MTPPTLSETAGLKIEVDEDGILYFKIYDASRATVDAMIDAFAKYDGEAYASGQSRHTIVDMRRAGWPTPYAIARMIQSSNDTPNDLVESVAIVINPDNLMFRLIEGMLKRLTQHSQDVTRIFTKEEEAINWLHERP